MKVRAQIAMVLNLDKCIGCHTCSVTCKNVWTSREGVEYAWFNNVETKPGVGYPKDWENQKHWNGGWLRKRNGKLQPRMGAKWRILANIFANPDLPQIDDYYEPFTFDYQHLHTAPDTRTMPTARPRSLITGQRMEKIEGSPNWEEILGGEFSKRSKDANFEGIQKEIYMRWPSHPFIQAVIRACGFPLAAPSANLANQISPTNTEHVRKQLGGKIALIVDGGQSQVGIESTVVDLTSAPPRLLRPGMIHEESLVAAMGKVLSLASEVESSGVGLRSPGLLKKHYSPKAKLVILNWTNDTELKSRLTPHASRLGASRTHIIAHTHIPSGEGFAGVSVIPHDAEAFARALYAELHRCDEADADLIVVEGLPDAIEWRAIADRLNRAAAS